MPSVVITTSGFSMLAQLTGKAAGVANLRVAEYPGPLGMHDADAISRNAARLVDAIVQGLTGTGAAGVSRSHGASHKPDDIVFTGTYDEIATFFREKDWSDGLPIVPPTVERIGEFLEHTDRSATAEIAVLPSANLRATPWNVAANAVMAGCAPRHLPLLLAAVEALADERCNLSNIGSSSGIFPYLLVNGPIVRALDIGCGPQAISRGPNYALGRAIGLILRNIAGFRPGATYMGTFGYPLPFAIGENENESPWPPFHVERGYSADSSTVTMGVTNNWGSSPAPYDTVDRSGAQTALDLICREIAKKSRVFNFPARGPTAEHVMITVFLSPPVAQSLAAAGYSKNDVKHYVYENTTMPLREFEWLVKYTMIERTTLQDRVHAGILPDEFLGKPDQRVRILSSPDILHVIVCGDPGRNRIMVLEGGHTRPTTRPVL